ncbi:MAG: hypothetical protein GY808_19945, partial [Gammaproteobacteria bacterium]|nr:hypothetical protein [Gammaproteobacteria bacterium]
VGIATGIVKNLEGGKPINGAVISINDTSYVTDTYESLFHNYSTDPEQLSNGFYYLDGLNQDSVEITVEADGYYSQSKTISMVDTFFSYADFNLISNVPPLVRSSTPTQADTNVLSVDKIQINFSRPMNTSSVDSNFSILPYVEGSFSWSDNKHQLIYNTKLDFITEYTVTVDSLAEDTYQHKLDGNSDGVGGDSFVLTFKTGLDDRAPVISTTYPASSQDKIELLPIISYQYDEQIDPLSLNIDPFELIDVENQEQIPGQFQNYVVNDRTVFNYFPEQKLDPLKIYNAQVQSGLSDVHGNETAAIEITYFETGNYDFDITEIESFDGAFTDNWWHPGASFQTTGITENTAIYPDTSIVNLLTGGTKSMRLEYEWDRGSTEWFIREYLGGGPAQGKTFNTDFIVQVYIFGDGSNTKFRFTIDEGSSSSNWTSSEVSTWFTIDWIGWKLVEWDLSDPEMVGSWIGNGDLDKSHYRMDSFQLTY